MFHRSRRVIVAALLVVVVPLSGCTALTQLNPDADVPADLQPFYTQTPDWEPCDADPSLDCATLTAPLDWADPTGDTIDLAVVKAAATGKKIGTVFVNPGGPGASGVDWMIGGGGATAAVTAEVNERFDVVSWDPRGAGASSAVSCGSDADLDHFFYDIDPAEPDRGTDAWFTWAQAQDKAFADACAAHTGPLLGHISTTDSARDLDMLRGVMKDRTLTYVGYSTGTLLGAIYAELFPTKTGRMVLDGAVDPKEDYVSGAETQQAGFDSALKAYLEWCVNGEGKDGCPFSGTVDDAIVAIQGLYDELDKKPLKNSDGRLLGSDAMSTAVDATLYSKDSWPYLSDGFLSAAYGDASYPFYLADFLNDRDENGHYTSNLVVAFPAISCLDNEAMATPDEVRAAIAADTHSYLFTQEQPGYAAMGCDQWPYPADRTAAPITAAGSSDILVIGTTNDPATPYANAVSLADQLENGHLVTYTGEGHTAYNGSSQCVNETVDAYLLTGTVPATDPKC